MTLPRDLWTSSDGHGVARWSSPPAALLSLVAPGTADAHHHAGVRWGGSPPGNATFTVQFDTSWYSTQYRSRLIDAMGHWSSASAVATLVQATSSPLTAGDTSTQNGDGAWCEYSAVASIDGSPILNLTGARVIMNHYYLYNDSSSSILSTAGHELGHCVGLYHQSEPTLALMNPTIRRFDVFGINTPQSDDLLSMDVLY